ncbi:MAG: isocitrate lyase/PEP mutase family protein, partial [Burkholderiales bacterium]
GYGNAVNVHFTVRELEAAGAAGLNLEDQTFPKRCGHMSGKDVIAMDEMVRKVDAARCAARDPDFVINARTDALAVLGLEETIRRGNAYARAGATLVYVEAVRSEEEIAAVVAGIEAPVSITLGEGGRTPLLTFERLQELGVARVSCPGTALFAAIRGIEDALRALRQNDGPAAHASRIADLNHYREVIGWGEVDRLERRYA